MVEPTPRKNISLSVGMIVPKTQKKVIKPCSKPPTSWGLIEFGNTGNDTGMIREWLANGKRIIQENDLREC